MERVSGTDGNGGNGVESGCSGVILKSALLKVPSKKCFWMDLLNTRGGVAPSSAEIPAAELFALGYGKMTLRMMLPLRRIVNAEVFAGEPELRKGLASNKGCVEIDFENTFQSREHHLKWLCLPLLFSCH